MKKPNQLKTAFSQYDVKHVIGQGGNGMVYQVSKGTENFAAKVLDSERATTEKLRRFKNEFKFCSTIRHENIILVDDYGLTETEDPFFIMPLYHSSLRPVIGEISNEDKIYNLITKILNGIDAAHQFNVIHRDLKTENILVSENMESLVLADFGIARFKKEDMQTLDETHPKSLMETFNYAAPEQKVKGGKVDQTTDIFSLGLIINELFVGEVPYGINHTKINEVSEKYSFLDPIVQKMMEHKQENRYQSIEEIKLEINVRFREHLDLLKIDKLKNIAIPKSEIDDPIINQPMKIIDAEWRDGLLTITLNHTPNETWKWAFLNMGSFSSVMGKGPEMFQFHGNSAKIMCNGQDEPQRLIDHFKNWLPKTAHVYENKLRDFAMQREQDALRKKREAIEKETREKEVNTSLKF